MARPDNKNGNNKRRDREEDNEFIDRLVHINRVAKTVKGGRNMSFAALVIVGDCLLYTSPSPRDKRQSRMPSSA